MFKCFKLSLIFILMESQLNFNEFDDVEAKYLKVYVGKTSIYNVNHREEQLKILT